MANEISLNFSLNVSNGNFKESLSRQAQVTQSTAGAAGVVQSIGTSEEDLAAGDVATNGYLFVQNLDATNFVTYGPKSAGVMVAFGKLKAGEWAVLRVKSGVTVRLLADTAACRVQYLLLED